MAAFSWIGTRAVWRTAAALGLTAVSRVARNESGLEDRGGSWFGRFFFFSGRNESGLEDRGGRWFGSFFSDRNESGLEDRGGFWIAVFLG